MDSFMLSLMLPAGKLAYDFYLHQGDIEAEITANVNNIVVNRRLTARQAALAIAHLAVQMSHPENDYLHRHSLTGLSPEIEINGMMWRIVFRRQLGHWFRVDREKRTIFFKERSSK
jgi:hypothetical protein